MPPHVCQPAGTSVAAAGSVLYPVAEGDGGWKQGSSFCCIARVGMNSRLQPSPSTRSGLSDGQKSSVSPNQCKTSLLRAQSHQGLCQHDPSTSYSPEGTRTGTQSTRKAQHPSPVLPALAVSAAPLLNLDQSSTPRGLQ